jgi:hypothetical protein
MVFTGVAYLATNSLMQYVYSATVDTAPGTVFFVSTGFEVLSLASILVLYFFVSRHERAFGDLGHTQKSTS